MKTVQLILFLVEQFGTQRVILVYQPVKCAPINSAQAALGSSLDADAFTELSVEAHNLTRKKQGQDLAAPIISVALKAQDSGPDKPDRMGGCAT